MEEVAWGYVRLKKETKKIYKKHLKQTKERFGFFPKDFKKSLKGVYEAMDKYA